MAPEIYAARKKARISIEEIQAERERAERVERLREGEEKRRNPFSGLTPEEQRRAAERATPAPTEVLKIQSPPPIPPVMAPKPESGARGPQARTAPAPQAVERRETRETTKTEKLDLGHYDSQGKYEAVEGQNQVRFSELERLERSESPSAQSLEADEERLAQVRERMQARAQVQVVREAERTRKKAAERRTSGQIEQADREERLAREREAGAGGERERGAGERGPMSEADAERAALRKTVEEAMAQNRPALLIQGLLPKTQEGPLDLLRIDERKAGLLERELRERIGRARKERTGLLARIRSEKDADKRRVLRVKLRGVLAGLAFCTKAQGMLRRMLGGFFGKLSGGLMK